MTTSLASSEQWPELEGRREPEHLSQFDGDDRLGLNALTLAGRIGNPPMPWQIDNLIALLRIDEHGMWTHPDAVIICPRQNGKSEILLLRCLYGLFVRGENIVFSTQQWKTARKLAIRFKAMIKSRPDLKRRLACEPTLSQGQSIVTTTSGAELIFCTRSGDTGKGLDKVDLVIYDEAYNLTEAEMTGPTLAQMAARNPQTIYTSSAVFNEIHQNGQVLAGIRRNGLRKADGLYFAEYMAPEPPTGTSEAERRRIREDPQTARLANPSFGVIQTDAKVRKSLLGLGGTSTGRRSFEVDVLGWGDWPVDAEIVESEIPAEVWRNMRNPAATLTGPRVLVLCREATWAIAAAQRTTEGHIHLEVGYVDDAPAAAVVCKLVEVYTAWNPAALVVARGAAAEVLPELELAGIEATVPTRTEEAQACGGFLSDALASALSHTGQEGLSTAVANAVKKELTPSGFIWDVQDAASHAQLMGATLARWALVKFGAAPKRKTVAPRTAARRPARARAGRDLDLMRAAF
jgi:hypothetical protein